MRVCTVWPVITPLLYLACALGVIGTLEGLIARRRVQRQLQLAHEHRPTDESTGLWNERAYMHRVESELKRVQRGGSNLWLGVWTVVDGDPERFGRMAADGIRFPEIGFRLSDRVFCFVRPAMSVERRDDLHRRLRNAAPRERSAIGEIVWRGGEPDAMRLLHAAIDRME